MIEFGLKISSQMYRVAFFLLNLWVMPGIQYYAPPILRYIPLGQISYFGLAASNVYDQNCRSFVFLAQQMIVIF